MGIIKLAKNRVWRTYKGGKSIDQFYGIEKGEDNHKPEVWVSSVVEARNPEKIENEGLSFVEGKDVTLKSIIDDNPELYLGKKHAAKYGANPGVLIKLLDSAERLTIQVHPDKEKAQKLFNSRFGKTEAWMILGGREVDGDAPHIYFGFKEEITRDKWEEVFNSQNIEEMLGLMNKVYVESGDLFLIEGGMPHAIGAGCFILEIQEPTDYTIRTERITPNGYEIPDMLLHQGLGFSKMFDCFDYVGHSLSGLERWKLKAKDNGNSKTLIDYNDTKCFGLEEILVDKNYSIDVNENFYILICIEGSGTISDQSGKYNINQGDQFFIPADSSLELSGDKDSPLKVLKCLPPES